MILIITGNMPRENIFKTELGKKVNRCALICTGILHITVNLIQLDHASASCTIKKYSCITVL